MATAERLAVSIQSEGRGVHVLLWDDQHDLVRALISLQAAAPSLRTHALIVSTDEADRHSLRQLAETRIAADDGAVESARGKETLGDRYWWLFLPQASSSAVGPWLNGWRRPISAPPGSLLVIRHADFLPFQRQAPDLASFFGARIYDASTMLSEFSATTYRNLRSRLTDEMKRLLHRLPGTPPSERELADWIESQAPDET